MSVLDISGAHSTSRMLCRQDAVRYINLPSSWGDPAYLYSRDGSRLGSSLIRQSWTDIGPGNSSGTVPHYSVSQMSFFREVFLREPAAGNFEIERAYTFSSTGKTSFITSLNISASAPSPTKTYIFPDITSDHVLIHPQRVSSAFPTDIAWWLKAGRYVVDIEYEYNVPTWSAPSVALGTRTNRISTTAFAVLNTESIRKYQHMTYDHSGTSGGFTLASKVLFRNYPLAKVFLRCPHYISYDDTTTLGLLCSDKVTLTSDYP